jgi:hypothetical protein
MREVNGPRAVSFEAGGQLRPKALFRDEPTPKTLQQAALQTIRESFGGLFSLRDGTLSPARTASK